MTYALDPRGTARLVALGETSLDAPTYDALAYAKRQALYLASEIVRADEPASLEPLRDLIACYFMSLADGHTALDLNRAALERTASVFSLPPARINAMLATVASLAQGTALPPWVGADEALFVLRAGKLASRRTVAIDARVASAVRVRLCPTPWAEQVGTALSSIRLDEAASKHSFKLSDEQMRAIECAASARFALLTGGPGTGKTSILVALLRTLVRCGVDPSRIALAAPTGRAAQRMYDATMAALSHATSPADVALAERLRPAATLHRWLGLGPRKSSVRTEIEADVVVVDEASMLDENLADALFSGVSASASLVLVGDVDQLPPVDEGAVFADLISFATRHAPAHVARLTRSFRMDPRDVNGRAILLAAHAARDGNARAFFDAFDVRELKQGFGTAGASRIALPPDAQPLALVGHWLDQRLDATTELSSWRELVARTWSLDANDAIVDADEFSALSRVVFGNRVLCALREAEHDLSVRWVNARMHERHARVLRGMDMLRDDARWIVGAPVVIERNDARLGLFNGDSGVVVRAHRAGDDAPRVLAVFAKAQGWVAFDPAALGDNLALSHATTVHKSQGSEFDDVVVLLPRGDASVASRELVYTALTRAKKSACLVASDAVIEAALARHAVRVTVLNEALESS